MKVAFIGLGVMGYPMAGHVLRAGLEICVFNRNAARAEQWCAEHGVIWRQRPQMLRRMLMWCWSVLGMMMTFVPWCWVRTVRSLP